MYMAKVFSGDNPSQLYLDAMMALLNEGEVVGPRGKQTKELRPVIFEYTNPRNRVTFLKGRVINPFFQLAESLWIMAGRSDVKWLAEYNKSIANFSDDGEHFNAPYGERLRFWGKNDASHFVFNPIDQLYDCYLKLKQDPETRQAVAFIGDPRFDNYEYTVEQGGKDIACNLNIKFKIRNGKLDATVDNRSNDLHWGTFGANLAQFATLQELMASWLGLEVGTYCQITDSLHIYLNDYGAKETDKVASAYRIMQVDDRGVDRWVQANGDPLVAKQFVFDSEPRMSASYESFTANLRYYFMVLDPMVRADHVYEEQHLFTSLIEEVAKCSDAYIRNTVYAMIVYQAHRRNKPDRMIDAIYHMPDSSWKVSCLRFLSKRYLNAVEYPSHSSYFRSQYEHLSDDIIDYIERKGE